MHPTFARKTYRVLRIAYLFARKTNTFANFRALSGIWTS